jgi:hypothetical protein
MATTNQVLVSEAVTNNRFSAEFFDSRYVFQPRRGWSWLPIGRLLKKCEYGLSVPMNSEGLGFPIFRMNELDGCLAQRPAKFANIPRALFEAYRLEPDDVLFNRTNSFDFVGRTGIVKDQTDCTFASYLIRLVPDSSRLLPEFLTIYLNTPFGVGQVKRRAMRSINQANVSGSEIRKVLIPEVDVAAQQPVADLVNQGFAALRDSKGSYRQAEQLLEAELGLNELIFAKPIGYTVQFSDLQSSRRADADFHNPELRWLWQELSQRCEMRKMTAWASPLKFSNPEYGDTGAPIITQKHLRVISPEGYGSDLLTTDAWTNSNSNAQLRKNDLLFYSVGAYLGKTNIWLNHNAAVPASFITLLRCFEDGDAGYLQVLLNSRYGLLQSKCFQSGTSQQYIYPKDIRNFLIPVVERGIRDRISDLVVASYECEQRSKKLLDEAKARVEAIINEAVQR